MLCRFHSTWTDALPSLLLGRMLCRQCRIGLPLWPPARAATGYWGTHTSSGPGKGFLRLHCPLHSGHHGWSNLAARHRVIPLARQRSPPPNPWCRVLCLGVYPAQLLVLGRRRWRSLRHVPSSRHRQSLSSPCVAEAGSGMKIPCASVNDDGVRGC